MLLWTAARQERSKPWLHPTCTGRCVKENVWIKNKWIHHHTKWSCALCGCLTFSSSSIAQMRLAQVVNISTALDLVRMLYTYNVRKDKQWGSLSAPAEFPLLADYLGVPSQKKTAFIPLQAGIIQMFDSKRRVVTIPQPWWRSCTFQVRWQEPPAASVYPSPPG